MRGKTFDKPEITRFRMETINDLWIDPATHFRMISSNDGGGVVSINGGNWTRKIIRLHSLSMYDYFWIVALINVSVEHSRITDVGHAFRRLGSYALDVVREHGWHYAVGGAKVAGSLKARLIRIYFLCQGPKERYWQDIIEKTGSTAIFRLSRFLLWRKPSLCTSWKRWAVEPSYQCFLSAWDP